MRIMKDLVAFAVGLLAAIYLVYPSLGVFEFIPDMVPFIGNLDEASATVLLIGAFRYFGIDVARLFRRDDRPETIELPPTENRK